MNCRFCLGKLKLTTDLKRARCGRKKCRKINTIYKTDFFKNCKLGIEKGVLLLFYLLNAMPTKFIQMCLGTDKKTIYTYRRKITKIMKKEFKRLKWRIGGKKVVIEVDESKFGKRKYNRGRMIDGVWVVGLVERTEQRKIILKKVKTKDKDTLSKIVKKYVKKGSKVFSDEWKGYVDVENMGYTHRTVCHKRNYVNPVDGTHTNTIEGNWSGIKYNIPKRYRREKSIDFYLLRFMFERNIGKKFFEYIFNLL